MKSPTSYLIVVIILLTATVGYLAGRGGLVFNNPLNAPSPSSSSISGTVASPSPVACGTDVKVCDDGSPVSRVPPGCDFAPCPSPVPQIIQAGGILSFPKYQVTIPANWTFNKSSSGENDQKLSLAHSDYEIVIQEGAFGGNVCLYPGDAPFDGPSQSYTAFTELATVDGLKLRRSSNGSSGFTVCQFAFDSWQSPTPYGHLSIKSPATPTPSDLAVVDNILKSLKKL